MENLDVDLKIQELKAAATNQTEFVQGLLIYLLIQSKTLDDIIENFGTDDLKEVAGPFRHAIPHCLMSLSVEIQNIHVNDNKIV